MSRKFFFVFLSIIGLAIGDRMNLDLVDLYLHARPSHLQIKTSDDLPEANQAKFTTNEPYSGYFIPLSECSENRTVKLGDTGTVSSPNYPKNYDANMACEWKIEGPPGSKIEAVFFDVYTQPWFFAYFDYVMVARNGNFSNVDRMSGDMNAKTPLVVVSDENVLGIRFRSSSLFNFRGFKAQYLVVPDPKFEQEEPEILQRPVFDGICGYPSVRPDSSSSTTSTEFPSTFVTDEETTFTDFPSSTDDFSSTDGSSTDGTLESSTTEFSTDGSSTSSTGAPPPSGIPVITGNRNGSLPFDPNIIGGAEVLRHSYPWMAALLIDNKQFCGGSLIDDQHILTAAHCTNRASSVTVLLGTHNIKAPSAIEDSRKIYNVSKENIYQHPEYNENTISHDISILRLPEKVTFSDRIKPVCLPNRQYLSKFFTDEETVVSGWGKPADNAPGISPFLKEADVRVMPNSQCRLMFRGIVTGNLICVATTRVSSPCKGDSGGPLMIKQNGPLGPYYTQLGIVSFGSLTCERAFPVGFTRVTAFMDYISEVTGKTFL